MQRFYVISYGIIGGIILTPAIGYLLLISFYYYWLLLALIAVLNPILFFWGIGSFTEPTLTGEIVCPWYGEHGFPCFAPILMIFPLWITSMGIGMALAQRKFRRGGSWKILGGTYVIGLVSGLLIWLLIYLFPQLIYQIYKLHYTTRTYMETNETHFIPLIIIGIFVIAQTILWYLKIDYSSRNKQYTDQQ